MYIYIYIYTYTYIYIYINIYIYIYIHTYIYRRQVGQLIIVHSKPLQFAASKYAYIHKNIHIYLYTHAYVCIYIYTYTHVYLHIYIHVFLPAAGRTTYCYSQQTSPTCGNPTKLRAAPAKTRINILKISSIIIAHNQLSSKLPFEKFQSDSILDSCKRFGTHSQKSALQSFHTDN